jgi:ribonuclease R
VTGVQAFGLFVELEEVYVQGLVHVSSMTDDYYRFDEKAHRLEGESAGKLYRLGDRASVQVARVDLDRRQIDFALVDVLERARAGARKTPRSGGGPRRGSGTTGRPAPGKPGRRPKGPRRGSPAKGPGAGRGRRKN